MNVVDSSGWLEYLSEGPNHAFFQAAVEDASHLIVPTITITEVERRLLQQGVEQVLVLELTGPMRRARVVPLDVEVAIEAAFLGTELKLPLTDSIILATARLNGATLWTQDADFLEIEGVKYVAARKSRRS